MELLLVVLFSVFVAVSPIIALVAIIQWVGTALHKQEKIGSANSQNDYQRGYADGFAAATNQVPEALPAEKDSEDPDVTNASWASFTGYATDDSLSEEVDEEPSPLQYDDDAPSTAIPEATSYMTQLNPEQRAARNLNILLSLSSLLFVAAGIAFISSTLFDEVKLVGIIGIVVLFYGGGMVLHAYSTTLRPAAVAFIGTGLALVPFLGVAFAAYTPLSDTQAWFITSVLGLSAYLVSALYLKNQIVSYLTVAFVLSLSSSIVATASAPFVWYFASFILVSLLASCVAFVKPAWVPEVFKKPIEQTGNLVTPLALVASVFAAGALGIREYEIVFGLATLHYFVSWLQSRTYWLEQIVRVAVHITLLIVLKDIAGSDMIVFGLGFLGLAVVQQTYSLVRQLYVSSNNLATEYGWIGSLFGIQFVSCFFWMGSPVNPALTSVMFGVMLAMSILATCVVRRIGFGYVALFVSFVLPLYAGRQAFAPAIGFDTIATVYLLLSTVSLVVYRRVFFRHGDTFGVFGTIATITHLMLGLMVVAYISSAAVALVLTLAACAIIVGQSHVYKQSYAIVAVSPVVLYAMYWVTKIWNISGLPTAMIWFGGVALVAYAGAGIYRALGDRKRGNALIAVGNAVVIPLAFASFDGWTNATNTNPRCAMVIILTVLAIISVLAKRMAADRAPVLRQLHLASSVMYAILAIVLAVTLTPWWLVLALSVTIAVLWEGSYSEKSTGLVVFANILTAWLIQTLVELSAGIGSVWQSLLVTAISAVLFYSVYWWFVYQKDTERSNLQLVSVWVALGLGSLMNMFDPITATLGALLVVAAGITIYVEGVLRKSDDLLEGGIYGVLAGLSLVLYNQLPELNIVFYAHIWAFVIGACGWWRQQGDSRFMLALGLVTSFLGLYALSEGGTYSALFLMEHILVVLAGALLNRPWAVKWGISASVVAVFYYLRETPYLVFTLLGMTVVAFVIWRLTRAKKA